MSGQIGARTIGALCVSHNVPSRLPAHEIRTTWVTLENTGPRSWEPGRCQVALFLDGNPLVQMTLPARVAPGARVTLHTIFRVEAALGRHELSLRVSDDAPAGLAPQIANAVTVPIDIIAPVTSETTRLRDRVLETHARCWLPADGMTWSDDGAGYPSFARSARGCRITDVEGRQYIDYLMGWGTALLGYTNERIVAAIAEALQSGAVPALTPHLMPEVADLLCEMFPSAEAVTFGKNGSDVCTAAVRLARAYTGREIVLVCGYHGWQDWFVERFGRQATGVPGRASPLVLQFHPHNLAQVEQVLGEHRGNVAAVMLEPAGVLEGFQGPARDADPEFLHALIELAHREGALVIFDEIMTGFRYLRGSVQHATGTRPDLTCLGKALSNGMPLSAVVGRRDIFTAAIGRISFEPTFKGEAYSYAAALAALAIFKEEDVSAQIWQIGNDIRRRLNRLCGRHGLAAEVIGPPYRMLMAFAEPDGPRRALMRTLLHQELLKEGVVSCQNLLLPSIAHDGAAVDETERAFDRALRTLAMATEEDRFAAYLEIPPLPA
jgi:glutamate-1-semialdehyde aminotransferase